MNMFTIDPETGTIYEVVNASGNLIEGEEPLLVLRKCDQCLSREELFSLARKMISNWITVAIKQ